jgi:class III poly(R)-hydroxyalkanoic acid synthase PhaE subunit
MKHTTNGPFDFESIMKNWTRTMQDAMETMPQWQSIFQSCMDGASQFQEKMNQSAETFFKMAGIPEFDQFDATLLHAWSHLYEKEFKKFFHIPQLGLTREYQEHFNDMVDKFYQLQAVQSEFLGLLSLPFQKAISEMQEKLANMAEKGLPEDANAYYQMWIKILERHFMTLFQSHEYIQSMSKTIVALSRFTKAKNLVIEDLTKGLPIARRSEMDALAKEVYELKKRIQKLEKK